MNIESVNAYEYTYVPIDRSFPIRSCVLTIYARNRHEADNIAEAHAFTMFDQNLVRSVRTLSEAGFKQV